MNVEDLRGFWDRGPLSHQATCECNLVGGQLRWAAEAQATRLGGLASATGTLPDQFALELQSCLARFR
jgi:hypothetical protein